VAPVGDPRERDQSFALQAVGRSWNVTARIAYYASFLEHQTGPPLPPRVDEEMAFHASADGFVFVVDVSPERAWASVTAFEVLANTLRFHRRDVDETPIVFQANRLDAPGAHSMSWVREHFQAKGAAFVESDAVRGSGTVEAIEWLLGHIRGREASNRAH
jgi:hypothetical protein